MTCTPHRVVILTSVQPIGSTDLRTEPLPPVDRMDVKHAAAFVGVASHTIQNILCRDKHRFDPPKYRRNESHCGRWGLRLLTLADVETLRRMFPITSSWK